MENRITPSYITELKENEVFVFGSNKAGRHGKGAAKLALSFGAHYGQAEGQQGNTYAIPTVDFSVTRTLGVMEIKIYVDRFIVYAKQTPDKHFLVTEIGCGLAGLSPKDIAPLFSDAGDLLNVWLPHRFRRLI